MFNYDWFAGEGYRRQQFEARRRCAEKHFPDLPADQREQNEEYQTFSKELEVRTLIYLRDGFSYELKEMVDLGLRSSLSFECEPVDDQYKVGAFVVAMAFDEIVRIEVFAVHPKEKPEDTPLITGFRNTPMREEIREER